MPLDYSRYYDLESYLFVDVHKRFHAEKSIGAFDFFSIVIWKANRAKSKIAQRVLSRDPNRRSDLEAIVRDLSSALYRAPDARERLSILLHGWGFYLPMATSVLSVFWPQEFSVYDIRVCDQLGRFQTLGSKSDFAVIWDGYGEYLKAVRQAAPANLNLRDRDRYLWGKSVAEQLRADISVNFARTVRSVLPALRQPNTSSADTLG